MQSSIGEFPKIGKFLTLRSPDKSGKNSLAFRTNSEIFQGEPLRGEFEGFEYQLRNSLIFSKLVFIDFMNLGKQL